MTFSFVSSSSFLVITIHRIPNTNNMCGIYLFPYLSLSAFYNWTGMGYYNGTVLHKHTHTVGLFELITYCILYNIVRICARERAAGPKKRQQKCPMRFKFLGKYFGMCLPVEYCRYAFRLVYEKHSSISRSSACVCFCLPSVCTFCVYLGVFALVVVVDQAAFFYFG